MDREEKIYELASCAAFDVKKSLSRVCREPNENDLSNMFIAGALWADTHPKSPWISVEDSYPPFESETEKTRFLVRVISGSAEPKIIYTIAYLLRYDKFNVEMDWVRVTHWMPIPYME